MKLSKAAIAMMLIIAVAYASAMVVDAQQEVRGPAGPAARWWPASVSNKRLP